MMRHKSNSTIMRFVLVIVFSLTFLTSCGPSEIEFAVKHLRDQTGEQITEVLSSQTNAGFDNSAGAAALQVQVELERRYRNQIIENMTNESVSGQRVRNKIVELYKLSPNDPEGTVQTALCPLPIVIPAGAKAIVTVEWTERWAEGVINEGKEGEGDQLGTYKVFLGYIEPCSLIKQENVR
jgi:hypothetical protein